MPRPRLYIDEIPEEVRTQRDHFEFYVQSGIIKCYRVVPGASGYHAVKGSLKWTLNLSDLAGRRGGSIAGSPRFFSLLRLMLQRWDPTQHPVAPKRP